MNTKQIIFNPTRYETDRIRDRARLLVGLAIKQGTLIRPNHCPRCGEPEQRFRNGRTNIEGHHHDYSKPLEVEWVCRRCHRKEEKENGKPSPLPALVDNPQLIALRDAVLSDDWARRPAKRCQSCLTLDEYESQGDFYPAIGQLRRWLGEWRDGRVKRKRGLSALPSHWGPMRRAQSTD